MVAAGLTLPNLIIAGVGKAGTTSLFWYLAQHPDVCPSDTKELGYFSAVRYGAELEPIEHYAQHFRSCDSSRYAMEATPGYFYGRRPLIEALATLLPDPRVIVILREPVTRFWSYYNFQRSRGRLGQDVTVEEYLATCERLRAERVDGLKENNTYWALSSGFYADHLDDWVAALGDRFKVIFFDDLVTQPAEVVRRLADWLGIDSSVAADFDYSPVNKTVQYRSALVQRAVANASASSQRWLRDRPALAGRLRSVYHAANRDRKRDDRLDDRTRQRLERHYAPANERLAAQLREAGYAHLPGWLASASLPGTR